MFYTYSALKLGLCVVCPGFSTDVPAFEGSARCVKTLAFMQTHPFSHNASHYSSKLKQQSDKTYWLETRTTAQPRGNENRLTGTSFSLGLRSRCHTDGGMQRLEINSYWPTDLRSHQLDDCRTVCYVHPRFLATHTYPRGGLGFHRIPSNPNKLARASHVG